MSDLPTAANVVVIGSGIVGNSVVGHLAELGWRDIVQIDKGPLPNPGGSTGHASNFIFPVDHNREMAALTLDSQRQYEAMGVNTTCGGIEIARKPERLEEFRRRMTSATAWGIDAELLTPTRSQAGAVHQHRHRARRLLHAERLGRRLAARGTIFRERRWRSARCRRSPGVEVLGDRRRERARAGRRHRPGPNRPRSTSWSRAGCGARASRRWPARRSRSRPRCTR